MRPLERITTWLCFMAALFMGVSPAQSFVLCLEADGCVTLELPAASGDDCRDCDDHADEGASCACVDLPVPGIAKDLIVKMKRIERSVDPSISVPFAIPFQACAPLVVAELAPVRTAPRPSGSLLLIRSVILLV